MVKHEIVVQWDLVIQELSNQLQGPSTSIINELTSSIRPFSPFRKSTPLINALSINIIRVEMSIRRSDDQTIEKRCPVWPYLVYFFYFTFMIDLIMYFESITWTQLNKVKNQARVTYISSFHHFPWSAPSSPTCKASSCSSTHPWASGLLSAFHQLMLTVLGLKPLLRPPPLELDTLSMCTLTAKLKKSILLQRLLVLLCLFGWSYNMGPLIVDRCSFGHHTRSIQANFLRPA